MEEQRRSKRHDENDRSENRLTIIASADQETSSTDRDMEMAQGEGEVFGSPETKAVFWLKWVLLVVLIASAVAVALAVYFYTTDAENSEFEEHYEKDADKVIEAISSSLFLSLGSLDAYSVNLASYARDSNSPWPFVTIPDFAVRAAKFCRLSKAFVLVTLHAVTEKKRAEWESYSISNDGWVTQAMEVQNADMNYFGPNITDYEPYGIIHGKTGDIEEPTGSFGYLPTWQNYPIARTRSPYNWDGASTMEATLPCVFDKAQVVLRIPNLPDPEDMFDVMVADNINDWAKDYIEPDEDSSEPILEVHYPIIAEAPDAVLQSQSDGKTVVGVLSPFIYWRELIKDLLPPGHVGIIVVFNLGVHQMFTYKINGPDVTYLGRGDVHDTRFDRLKISANLLELGLLSADYTGLPLSSTLHDCTIEIYPSAEMEDRFTTSDPILFTLSVVLIFAFTSAVFLMYDRFVEKRQRKVMHTAVQSTENVSLLERMVRERTRKLEDSNIKLEEANRKVMQASAAQLQHFACMSHEIRTPLNCIVGLSSLLEETPLDAVQQDSVKMIVASGDLLRAIVDDVLDFSKLESGNVDIDIKRSNLEQTLSSVVHSVEMKGQANCVFVRTSYDPRIPEFVKTDMRRLQQILYNLLGNAVKFSREGTPVDLMVEICPPETNRGIDSYSPEPEESTIDFAVPDKVLRFTVMNIGKGIKREDFPRIFKPFLQSGEETEVEYGGTGLGLAITSKLVHRLKGSISVESQEGEWAKFTVEIPFIEDPVNADSIASGLHMTTVLLASCDRDIREYMKGVFEIYGIACVALVDMRDLENKIIDISGESKLDTNRSYICLADEDIIEPRIFSLLESGVPSASLLTFGPEFSVPQAHGHFRSLTKILPSVLITRISGFARPQHEQQRRSLITRSSSIEDDPDAPYRKYNFMIAEDNVVNQKVLSRILSRLGITKVEVVNNGKRAVEREREVPFDVVFMDMQMPIMDGIDACRLINQRQGRHPRAKIVFVTAHVQDSFKAECLAAGGIGYLAKPCNIKNVEECLHSIIRTVDGCSTENIARTVDGTSTERIAI